MVTPTIQFVEDAGGGSEALAAVGRKLRYDAGRLAGAVCHPGDQPFQQIRGLTVTGQLDDATIDALRN